MDWNNKIGLDMNDMGNGWWQNHLQFRTNSGFNGDQTNRLTGSNGKSCRENHMRRKVKWQGLPLKKMSWGCTVPVVLVFKWITMVISPSGLPRKTMGRFRSATAPPSTLHTFGVMMFWTHLQLTIKHYGLNVGWHRNPAINGAVTGGVLCEAVGFSIIFRDRPWMRYPRHQTCFASHVSGHWRVSSKTYL